MNWAFSFKRAEEPSAFSLPDVTMQEAFSMESDFKKKRKAVEIQIFSKNIEDTLRRHFAVLAT